MNPVIHFELPAEDKKRMMKFYSTVFGWKTEMLGPETDSYVSVITTESGEDGRPKQPGAINGGFFQKSDTAKYPSVVIAVDDIQKAMTEVSNMGGKVNGEPNMIPTVGLYVSITDTEGNNIALLQPSR